MRVPDVIVRFARKSPDVLIHDLIRFARKSRHERAATIRRYFGIWDLRIPHLANDRTAYVIGLFGSGRGYINELILKYLGDRAKYFRETIRVHPGPTSMIYSGHATIKYECREQTLPEVTARILEAVRSGFADLIFINRHPVDSLLTNWVWWRTFIRDNMQIGGISQLYKNSDGLSAELEKSFPEFKTFADGDPSFFAELGGRRFLSLSEFVEEAELYLQSATLSVRLEDFATDPLKEFSKILKIMSIDFDSSRLHVPRPDTKMFRFLEVKKKSPRFRHFLDGLDADTKRRIEKMGYPL